MERVLTVRKRGEEEGRVQCQRGQTLFFTGKKKIRHLADFYVKTTGDPFDWVLKVQCMVSGNPNSLLQKKKIDGIGRKGKESLRTDDRVF